MAEHTTLLCGQYPSFSGFIKRSELQRGLEKTGMLYLTSLQDVSWTELCDLVLIIGETMFSDYEIMTFVYRTNSPIINE